MNSDMTKRWIKLIKSVSDEKELDTFLRNASGDSLEVWKKDYQDYYENAKSLRFSDGWREYEVLSDLSSEINWIDLYKPICNPFLSKLQSIINQYDFVQNKDEFMKNIEHYFFSTCMDISYRVVVLEINSLRTSGKLVGTDKYKRYQYYIEKMIVNDDYLLDFYRRYPVLFEILNLKSSYIFNYIIEILSNISKDWSAICVKFNINHLRLRRIKFNEGDTHNQGKTVCSLILEKEQLIYKPRSMDIDIALQNFITDFEASYGEKIMFVPTTLTIDDHSYVEFINTENCKNEDEVKEFYVNMGKLLAVLYMLGAKDFHGENIIVSGSYPYLIDNETIIHKSEQIEAQNCMEEIQNFISESVYGTGLLPMALYSESSRKAMEIGALNSGKERISPYATHRLVNIGTDEIKIDRVFKEVRATPSTVFLDSKPVSCEAYINSVHEGYSIIYNIITANKIKLAKMIRKYFYDLDVRYIYRNTNMYVQILETSYHPELLMNKVDRKIYFLRLLDFIEDNNTVQRKFFKSEIEQLSKMDVPIFYLNLSSDCVFDSDGSLISKPGVIKTIDKICNRLLHFSGKDFLRQSRIINMSFLGSEFLLPKVEEEYNQLSLLGSETLIKHLVEGRLKESCFDYKQEVSWLSMLSPTPGAYMILPMDYSLYNGTSGIILSLFDSRDSVFIDKILKYSYCRVAESDVKISNLGAFDGVFGYLYMLTKMSQLKKLSTENAVKIIYDILSKVSFDDLYERNNFDIISGLSGVLGVLLTVEDSFKNEEILQILCQKYARQIVSYLIDFYLREGLWFKDDMGYAHGNYGVLLQLFRYRNTLADINFSKKIDNIIDSFFIIERGNSLPEGMYQLRKNAKPLSWCNGIVGILQVKSYLLKNGYSDDKLYDEVQCLYQKVREADMPDDQSICHGSLGNLVLINQVEQIEQESLIKQLNVESQKYLESKIFNETDDWGLLTGEAGLLMCNSSKGRKLLCDILLLC